jgi:hypothetical protein
MKRPAFRPIQRTVPAKRTQQLRLPFMTQPKRRLDLTHLRSVPLAPPTPGSPDDELLRDLNSFASPRNSP